MTRRGKLVLSSIGLCVALTALALAGAVIVMQSDWFKNRVRGEIVRVTEDATGGRVEIGSFQYDWRSLTAQVGPFVLHGTEAAGSPPLFRAARIEVGLKVISLFERRVDLASLSVEKPEVHVFVGADGATNFPVPKRANPEAIVQQLFDLKVRRFVLHDGYAQYNSSRIPLDATGESLSSSFAYERGPRYVGMLDAQRICFERPGRSQAEFSLHSKLALEPNRLTLSETRLALSRTKLELSGTIEDLAALRGRFDVRAVSTLKDLEPVLALPASAAGDLNFEGNLSLRVFPTLDYSFAGKVTARNFSYAQAKIRVAGVAFATPIKLSPARLDFADLRVSALGGAIRGHLLVDGGTSLRFEGQANAISVPEALRLETGRDIALTGTVSGPLQVESVISHSGLENIHANARLELAPGEGGVPLGGNIDVQYDESSGRLEIADSDLRLGTSHLQASGVLGEQLSVHFTSNNLEDLLAAFPLVGQKPPEKPLVALKGGAAKFDGSITGILNRPRISGHVDLPRFQFLGREFDRLSGTVELTQSALTLRKASLQQGTARAEGDGEFGLVDWLPVDSSAISGKFAARGVDLQHVAAEAGLKVPVTGTASTVVAVEGTVSSPRATASIQAENIVAYQEHIDGVHANVIISADSIQASEAEMTLGAGRITLKGVYRHSHDDWSSGQIQFETASHGLTVQQFEHLRARYQTLSGQVDWKAGGKLQLVKGDVQQSDAAAELSLRNASFKGRPYGSLTLTANTHDAALDLHLRANLNATSIEGSGQWRLEGDYPGHGQFSVPHITIAAIHDLLPNPARKELPFEGFVEGTVDVEGPLLKFDEMRAQVRLNTLQINASAGAKPQAGAQARDLVLRSAKPILLEATTKRVDIRSAVLAGTGTSLSAEGHLSLDSLEPYNLRFQGSVNLAVLQIFNRNLLGSGVSEVNATVRGALDDPDVEGRLSLKNASLYLKDLPNGLDQANGLILFDRNRATVDSLTALTGAGTITLQKGSFVGFRGNTLLYRVQATADHVRYRSPEGISLTVNAALGLNGTSESSVLSGTVTVIRAGFNPTTDLGSLLASTTRPVSAPAAPNEYLQGVQFDVRIDSAQALEIQTSLTRNIEADVNLRIRGTPDRPIVLGNLSINQGEIEFFGNRYAINRGDMNFYNPAKIEPIIDMDLQTSVRGVTVDVSFTGPLNKLNFSYRSDPPLQTGEIIALLAVGRDPNSAGTLAAGQNSSNSNYVATGNNELLAQAISQPNQGRLQRFFGVGHIKIDPQITDVTAIPQARLTFEQQVSKDVTMTYITNLARTQEQIIRVEWDFSSQWSAIALRDENGAFGIDFQYRKRFK